MNTQVIIGAFIPLLGTTLGALAVYFLKNENNKRLETNLCMLAAGVMLAASVWGLIIPSINLSESMQIWSFIPAVVGLWVGVITFIYIEKAMPQSGKIMPLAVFIHNIPEGMAVGVAFAVASLGSSSMATAMALSVGIAVQNIPEGAIISMPLYSQIKNKNKCFLYGMFSGVVEPIFALITVFVSTYILPIMPYLMSFAAGCMIYVCVSELIPKLKNNGSFVSVIYFITGFSVMLVLDVALG